MGSRGTVGRLRMPERRTSRPAHHDTSLPYHRRHSGYPWLTSPPSPRPLTTGNVEEAAGSANLDFLNFYDVYSSTPRVSSLPPTLQQEAGQVGTTGVSPALCFGNFSSVSPTLPRFGESHDLDQSQTSFSSPDSPHYSWDISTPSSTNFLPQSLGTPRSEDQSGAYGGLETIALSTPDTLASDLLDGFDFSGASPSLSSPISPSAALVDQTLPDEFHRHIYEKQFEFPNDVSYYPNEGDFEPDQPQNTLDMDASMYWTSTYAMLLDKQTSPQQSPYYPYQLEPPFPNQPPWTPEVKFTNTANTGDMTFEPNRGIGFRVFIEREKMMGLSLPERQDPVLENAAIFDGLSNAPGEQLTPKQSSPVSDDGDIPPHYHVFPVFAGREIQRFQPDSNRKLTPEKKRRTLEVRKNKACWACHLSKTQCSPCSSGSPCEKCASLFGKRRYCRVPCFNDPIESLHPFLLPDMLVGHFTEENVNSFVRNNASSWGTRSLLIRMSWGSRTLLEANVVQLFMHEESTELGLQHQVITNTSGRPVLVRKNSPPLGIPLASMMDLQEEYLRHVQDVVKNDLAHYVSIAYDDQRSKLPGRLLRAICAWYQAGVDTREKCALLKESIEIHIIGSILERSLILDRASMDEVQAHLGKEFPPRSAPRCAQRQIKLAFFMLQRPRVINVLEKWGKLMRNTADSNNRWATAFCVFLMLTLLMDKTMTAAYYLCEDRILDGKDAGPEREGLQRLVRLMETELFERCKEIFHSRYKTRKGANERFNPIQDGLHAWRKERPDDKTTKLIAEMQTVLHDFGQVIVPPSMRPKEPQHPTYTNLGRLASIFLGDFLADEAR